MRVNQYLPGTPSWTDLGTPDLHASRQFYQALFGWEPRVSTEPEAAGYTIFHRDGLSVAGVGALMSAQQPPAWVTYIATDSAKECASRVEAAGGTVLLPPLDVLKSGRMAMFADPTGAAFGVWEPLEFLGADVVDEPGAMSWNELATRSAARAKEFYPRVFGWEARDSDTGGSRYTEWLLEGRPVAGMMEMTGQWPADLPSHWMVYFAVDDCDTTVSKVEDLGGTVPMRTKDIPQGRFAVLADPQGAVFSVIQMPGA
ncbi:MAG TPA: VOC family protein [Micromonosporaceae bacterium]